MLGHIGQELDARLQRGARYQPQRGLIQIGAIGKRRILPGSINGSITTPSLPPDRHRFRLWPRTSYPGPHVVQVKVMLPPRPFR